METNEFHTCGLLRRTDPGNSPSGFDPGLGLRELKTDMWHVVVDQTPDGLHAQSALTNVENNAAVIVFQLYAGK
jgi:hypothetical protein